MQVGYSQLLYVQCRWVYNGESSSDYDTIIEFGLFDHMGKTGDYYSKSSPNGDRIKGRIAYGNGYYYGGGVG